jgi:hypothetical protein
MIFCCIFVSQNNNIMTTEKRDSIIKKIQLLKEKTVSNGCSEAEAMSATEKISQLLNEYDLSMSEVEMKSQVFEQNDLIVDGSVRKPIHDVVSTIGIFTDTKVWYAKKDKKFVYSFFGAKNDVEFAHYLFSLLSNSMDFEYKKFQKTNEYKMIGGKVARASFYKGMSYRLSQRLKDMKNTIKNDNQEKGIVLYDKMGLVKQKFDELNLRLKNESRKHSISDTRAYYAGRKAADNITINKGVSNTKMAKVFIG